jgi:hypothetical protein
LIGALTAMKASGILDGTSSEPRSMAEKANGQVDLSEKIVTEIEAFLLVVMNTEVIQYRRESGVDILTEGAGRVVAAV